MRDRGDGMDDARPLTDEDLAEMERRADAATSGPWRARFGGQRQNVFVSDQKVVLFDTGHLQPSEPDADFIAHAREDVPRLLRAELAELAELARRSGMPKITPFLWFDTQAEEAANYYVSLFAGSKITRVTRQWDAGPGPKGSVLAVDFELGGQPFTALNAGPQFKFTEAISFTVHCATQAEVDAYWNKLTAEGGQEGDCGWVKDRYGLSWQITPDILTAMLSDPDHEKATRVMQAMMTMKKIDIEALRQAYEQPST
jgi:predicted 3-demethylubiquinone-9 3-methyltransferase (glyoxalase superfamily)